MVCCSYICFTTELANPIMCYSNWNIIPRASKSSWIWYDFCQNLMIKILQKNNVVISLTLRFLEDFKIFLIMKMIQKIVRFWKFFRSCQRKVFSASSSIFIKIREFLLWSLDDYFLALILDMTSEQKRSSHVQTALTSKPFGIKIPDTTQMKDLLKSFLTITNFNEFLLD